MSQTARNEYLDRMRQRYAGRTTKTARGKLIDEFCEITEHERKYAIKLLRGQRCPPGNTPRKRGISKTYDESVGEVLFEIRRYSEQPCGKRLKPAIELWLPALEASLGAFDDELRTKVLTISPAQIDRKRLTWTI